MILNQKVEMVAAFNYDGKIAPIRFRIFAEDESYSVYTINKILYVDETKIDKVNIMIFKCKSIFNGIEKSIEIRYVKDNCQWYLYSI
ncbi:hypothetical protein [Clostridium manihotivorum]|uniref:Uncharacterized protein n=1 Tax=Clostridium manihotivorum TaxID=2320868 RepID=A0A410DQF4_9CLOT|nr:hypothetical protein [Clostridium manihotivorum]QAA31265.1 hypothetical protein C1I91_06175 [Clostridium manihotivorum]